MGDATRVLPSLTQWYSSFASLHFTSPCSDVDSDEEEEEKTMDWVTLLSLNKQKPPKDLKRFMPNGDIHINVDNVRRFNEKCTSIITNLKAHADQQTSSSDANFSDRTMTKVVIRVFQKLEVGDLIKAFLDSVPDVVKAVLGADDLSPTDPLYLPLVDNNFQFMGCLY
ncbi:hypothetical protein ACKAV7_004366 [Fusarium commune]